MQNDIIIASLDLCLEEKYALIAHEIGHFVYIYSKISPTVLTEEMFADDCAIELGLKNPLKSALGKCINSKLYANIDELKARINRL